MDKLITKRIHISGLTPAITAKDLSDRLASFGTVKAIDGFGALDALGQPRKFAYATLETTKGKLARCMNLLSGVTWKGAKLRLGEAKPDYRERIAQEQAELKRAAEEADGEPPNKRRCLRGVQGVHARDMSLVTPENVATRGGWRVTPTGRLIRPMRMRPLHPLPEPTVAARPSAESKDRGKGKVDKVKIKKRVRDPPTRARRKTIDPTKYGSQHLKGIFLENAAAFIPPAPPRASVASTSRADVSERMTDSSSETEGEDVPEDVASSDDSEENEVPSVPAPQVPVSHAVTPSQAKVQVVPSIPIAQSPAAGHDLVEENKQSLNLLQSLFGDADHWGGAESLDSDIEVEDERSGPAPTTKELDPISVPVTDSDTAMEVEETSEESIAPAAKVVPQQAGAAQKTKLKDLFAPREEEAGFSLLDHLDLDLELEDDLPFDVPAPAPSAAPVQPLAAIQPPANHVFHTTTLDTSRPFFFPVDHGGGKRNVHDPTNWRTWFYRTDTPEAIRARWEEAKGELTAGWKRRHREAIKSRRRRGGGNGGDAD
ncbi:hypothetical protein BD309DRAFT_855893 [Dichomitus squalens]|uniref:Uncharacterized protein n=1 Tax=Dichomitus squalens TaxID=114155 RepID=A0A4Q9PT84_9APHY|nr:hypothetical protein BD309DRAFT_855893 [Dichomitus squalens]TBU57682.1 hypothetical protein BD310DRAFT_821101 [Dichomitus squalens]